MPETIPPFNPELDIDGNGNSNEIRSHRALCSLTEYLRICYSSKDVRDAMNGTFQSEHIQDLISDLLHLAHSAEIDVDELLDNAKGRFIEESTPNPAP